MVHVTSWGYEPVIHPGVIFTGVPFAEGKYLKALAKPEAKPKYKDQRGQLVLAFTMVMNGGSVHGSYLSYGCNG